MYKVYAGAYIHCSHIMPSLATELFGSWLVQMLLSQHGKESAYLKNNMLVHLSSIKGNEIVSQISSR